MGDKPKSKIALLAELAVDDAIRMAEKFPGKKRTRPNKAALAPELEQAPALKPSKRGKRK